MAEANIVGVGMMGARGPRWTWDHSIERPAGEKDMGGYTAAVYTEEQQKRMNVDEMGDPVKKEEKKVVSGFGPRWTWDPEFEKPAGEKDMGGWVASVYTEEQQARLGCDEMGKAVEKEEKPALVICGAMGPRWTWDSEFEKPALRKDMGGWTASVYSAEQRQRLGVDEMGSPNRLAAQAFADKIYNRLCRDAFVAQYNAYKEDFVAVFGEAFKPLDMMKADSDYDRLITKGEFIDLARVQDRNKEGIERPWEMTAQQLCDHIFSGVDKSGMDKKEFLEKYSENKRAFQHVFQVDAIRWGDFRKGDADNDKKLSRDEFLVWCSVQNDSNKVISSAEADENAWKKLVSEVDNPSSEAIKSLVEKVFAQFGVAAMKAQYEYFTNDFKDQFGQGLQNLDFMKGDANYDRVTSKHEFLDWVMAQDKDMEGVERPWEMSAAQLADVIFESKPDGLSSKEFANEYNNRKQTFDTLLKGKLKFTDFRKGDANNDKKLTRDEFLSFVTEKQAESLQNSE